jgi:hypothetical protein
VDPIRPTTHYEAARCAGDRRGQVGPPVVDLTVLYRWRLPAWMHLIQERPQHLEAPIVPGVSPTIFAPAADAAATILVIASMLLARSMESSQCTPPPN